MYSCCKRDSLYFLLVLNCLWVCLETIFLVYTILFIFAVLSVTCYYFSFCHIMALLQTVLDHCQQCNAHLFSW